MTQTKQKTIKSVVEDMYNNFVQKERPDGTKYYCLNVSNGMERDIIHKAHLDYMPNDFIYDTIHSFLCDFSYLDDDAIEEDYQNIIYETEADCYTSNLTSWLNDNNNNVYYLTRALEEYDIKDGFQALSLAQKLHIEEIGNALLSAIMEYVEE